MNFAKALATVAVTFTFGLAGCGGGVEGTYKLDKTEMKKTMEAEVAKLPANEQNFAKLGMALLDAMEMSVVLESGGKLKAKSTSPSLEPGKPGKTEDKEGTWKQEGESLVLDVGDGKPLKCAKSGAKLSCTGDSAKKGEPSLVFVKS